MANSQARLLALAAVGGVSIRGELLHHGEECGSLANEQAHVSQEFHYAHGDAFGFGRPDDGTRGQLGVLYALKTLGSDSIMFPMSHAHGLQQPRKHQKMEMIPGSSTVEHSAVNRCRTKNQQLTRTVTHCDRMLQV